MALPLLAYKPSSQNQRVKSFGSADLNEDTPYIYRLEDAASPSEIKQLVWAAYRQVFSEHEILKFNRNITLETRFANRSLTVRDFIRELAKTEAFYRLVVSVNNNYRLVQICLKRLLGRDSYNKDEEITWSIVIATKGFNGFVDALVDSDEYTAAFGDFTIPYQRKRMEGRPFNLVTPRYGEDFQETAGTVKTDWRFTLEKFYSRKFQDRQLPEGDPRKFRGLAAAVSGQRNYAQRLSAFDIDYLNKVPKRR
ncbi:phycobilisome rod-core linker polypeptide [Planktothrix sp. FACHB-1355]|uniref:Phycobilisome rod-core linker polypeptide n=1 Tax=Aerosakkonema funiforme FACHB-1375 TaxID=2949571 RepID=A0A926VJI1_9CYAN|nr:MULTISPECIES: phycobilisome rod-core linker polypeptide [Oscillatoriales]MBD2184996.1 phycobilisome rod-core linker polypeptide [Aerosakkonema funiforme FACHB-1375]MBD3558123.1 phycobilisome rod-core linker polypeptide [Planktothrix sp. FACHB-1355]